LRSNSFQIGVSWFDPNLVDIRAGKLKFYKLLVAACALILPIIAACEKPPAPMPDDLIGVWTTDASGYEKRKLEIRSNLVSFDTGRFSSQFYLLDRVESLPSRDGKTTYRIYLHEEDGEISSMDLAYRDGQPPQIQFVNRRQVWVLSGLKEGNDG
jgi:hypothetical protein